MRITVLYVGSSLLGPLKQAEREISRQHDLALTISAHNFGGPLTNSEWKTIEADLSESEVVFAIHVMDGENANRLITALDRHRQKHRAVIVINCMPDLMRQTRMGKLDTSRLLGREAKKESQKGTALFSQVGSWIGKQTRRRKSSNKGNGNGHRQYLKLVNRLPRLLKFIPPTGKLRDIKNYLNIFCYFLQPTPANVRSMILYALKEYVPHAGLENFDISPPETSPSVAIYHPDASKLFESFEEYERWYLKRPRIADHALTLSLDPQKTVGLLLMRPQVISKSTGHYDALIRAIEAEGLSVIPALSTLMDNREASNQFFKRPNSNGADNGQLTTEARVSQIVSLTGFSFVGGPAMNDSEAAAEFLSHLNRPYRSAVSLDMQSIGKWQDSHTGLNPVQAGMQIAIPEIDGATEPFIYGGLPDEGVEPVPLQDRCLRFARRLRRWNRLRTTPRSELKLAFVVYCFPPNKGNIGTAADLDVFPGLWETLQRLKQKGYDIELPESAEALRDALIGGNADSYASTANVAYQMSVAEYRQLSPHVAEVESEWGSAPGKIKSFGDDLLIQGIQLGKAFVGVQPTFGYEGDPMRLMMARGGAPHHGFMAFYAYLSGKLDVDAVVHVGTHGAMEFMPGKQVGLSSECWPDRLIGELPNVYIYSVNNPSEGSIAKRRSYAELVSYLTPPIQNAGLYKELNTLKDLLASYRGSEDEKQRIELFASIEECAARLNLN